MSSLRMYSFSTLSYLNWDLFIYNSKDHLIDENQILKEKLIKLSRNDDLFTLYQRRNKNLEKILKIKSNDNYKYLHSRVIKPRSSFADKYVMINKGKLDSVYINAVVINFDGLCGRVIALDDYHAKVELINNPQFKIPIVTENNIPGIVVPVSSDLAEIREVTKSDSVITGKYAYVSGYSNLYPEGTKVCKIITVSDSSATIHKKIIAKFTTDFDNLDDLFLLLHKDSLLSY